MMTAMFACVSLGILIVLSILAERKKHKEWRDGWEASRYRVY